MILAIRLLFSDTRHPTPVPLDSTATRSITVVNPQGFHARPAHLFVKLATSFTCNVEILKGNEVINGKSILDLLTLGAGNGTTLTLRACGPDADLAVQALAKLVEDGFGEMKPAAEKA
jgi:phosphocarrier protein HPr